MGAGFSPLGCSFLRFASSFLRFASVAGVFAAIGAELSICKAFRTSPRRKAATTDCSKRAPSVLGLRGSEGTNGLFDRSTASFHKESGSDFHLLSLDLTKAAILLFLDK